ncbi:Cellulose synthase-like protein E6 [Bienertia sinuspersici]
MGKSEVKLLQYCQFHKRRAILNRSYTILNILAILVILYYRARAIIMFLVHKNYGSVSYYVIPWVLMFGSEVIVSFLWMMKQSMYWRPVTRTVFPENLPEDEQLPGIDVFICTADPKKEPTLSVMNTVISAMSLDYPAHKLSVYVSDDGGAAITLHAIKEAWVFATWWLPFCKSFNIKPICPQAYFENHLQDISSQTTDFIQHRNIIKEKYEIFKQRVRNWKGRRDIDEKSNVQDHPATVQVSHPFFIAYGFVFISSRLKHLCEELVAGGSVNAWLNEQRLAMIKGVTCYAYAALECVMAVIGLRQEASFIPTNKAGEEDKSKWYQIGKYDFRTSNMFLVPIVGAVILNVTSFVGGVVTVVIADHPSLSFDALFAQLLLSLYLLIISIPVIEGMLLRKDNACVPLSNTLISTMLSFFLLTLGYMYFILFC